MLRVSVAAGRVIACYLGSGKVSGKGHNWIHGIMGVICIEIKIADTLAIVFDGSKNRSPQA